MVDSHVQVRVVNSRLVYLDRSTSSHDFPGRLIIDTQETKV